MFYSYFGCLCWVIKSANFNLTNPKIPVFPPLSPPALLAVTCKHFQITSSKLNRFNEGTCIKNQKVILVSINLDIHLGWFACTAADVILALAEENCFRHYLQNTYLLACGEVWLICLLWLPKYVIVTPPNLQCPPLSNGWCGMWFLSMSGKNKASPRNLRWIQN